MEIFSVPVSVHLLLRKDNKILLMRRKNTGFADGMYSMPAGKLEPKESVEDAIIREAREEINIDIKNDAITRKIDQDILNFLKDRIKIKEPIRLKLTKEQVKIIKKEEW